MHERAGPSTGPGLHLSFNPPAALSKPISCLADYSLQRRFEGLLFRVLGGAIGILVSGLRARIGASGT